MPFIHLHHARDADALKMERSCRLASGINKAAMNNGKVFCFPPSSAFHYLKEAECRAFAAIALKALYLDEQALKEDFSLQKNLAPAKFSISADKKYLLLAQNVQKLFRHSFLAQYTVYDIQARWDCFQTIKRLTQLPSSIHSESISLTPKSEEEWPFLLYAQFTPRGHSLVMVYNYDIYYKTGPKSAQSYRITKTAIPGIIYNGVPDWLYEGWFIKLHNCRIVRLTCMRWARTTAAEHTIASIWLFPWMSAAVRAHATLFNDGSFVYPRLVITAKTNNFPLINWKLQFLSLLKTCFSIIGWWLAENSTIYRWLMVTSVIKGSAIIIEMTDLEI